MAVIRVLCVFVAAIAACHAVAGAQSVDGAVSPSVPPDPAELANRSLKLDYSAAPTALHIVLPAVDAKSGRLEARAGQPLQIGFPRTLPEEYRGDLSPLIDWTSLDDGSIVGAVSVTSPGARALRAGIRAELGSGGELRFFDGDAAGELMRQADASQHFPVMTREDFHEDGEPEIV